jgi:two-component system, LytTR family, response regulator
MMRTLIVDDEAHCREYLSRLITNYCSELSIVGTAKSVSEAHEYFARYNPELVFLDIQMPSESGFDFLDRPLVQNRKPWIIFTTAYDQYAIKAFRYSAVDYLLKPINIQELLEAVQKVNNRVNPTDYSFVSEIIDQLAAHRPVRKLCLPVSDGYDLAEIDTILYFESSGSYSNVFFTNRKPLLICKPVSYYEETLNPNRFIRVHRSYLVNLDHITSYNSDEDILVLSDHSKILVSKRKKAYLLQLIKGIVN